MSSVTYAPDGETKDPKTLVGFVGNKEFMERYIQPGDMLINNKTKEVVILALYTNSCYFINITTGRFHFQQQDIIVNQTRNYVMTNIIKSSDWEYIPVEQIKNLNFDIEMK